MITNIKIKGKYHSSDKCKHLKTYGRKSMYVDLAIDTTKFLPPCEHCNTDIVLRFNMIIMGKEIQKDVNLLDLEMLRAIEILLENSDLYTFAIFTNTVRFWIPHVYRLQNLEFIEHGVNKANNVHTFFNLTILGKAVLTCYVNDLYKIVLPKMEEVYEKEYKSSLSKMRNRVGYTELRRRDQPNKPR